ncbi:Fc.00g048440.m01.CDS01 [Cosmosporella sp. VM-42]
MDDPELRYQQDVYKALRDIFKGAAAAQLRQPKAIQKFVQTKHETQVQALIQEHSMHRVCGTARDLLCGGLFEFVDKAKSGFPTSTTLLSQRLK